MSPRADRGVSYKPGPGERRSTADNTVPSQPKYVLRPGAADRLPGERWSSRRCLCFVYGADAQPLILGISLVAGHSSPDLVYLHLPEHWGRSHKRGERALLVIAYGAARARMIAPCTTTSSPKAAGTRR